jgi:hypothetical protein
MLLPLNVLENQGVRRGLQVSLLKEDLCDGGVRVHFRKARLIVRGPVT